jgi:hypothetical protein
MANVAETLLKGQGFSYGRLATMTDPQFGGAYGTVLDLTNWASMTHYTRPRTYALVMQAPRFFNYMPDKEYYISALKALFETHAKSIDGLKSDLRASHDQTNVGQAGEQFDDLVNVERERTQPSTTHVDLAGRPLQNFLHDWITYGGMDPETKFPLVTTIADVPPTDFLADMSTATVLFFEPDATFTKVAKAWLVTNMFPDTTGEIAGKFDPTSQRDLLEISITWTALTQTGTGVLMLAQRVFDRMVKLNANPQLRQAFLSDMSAEVADNFGVGGAIDNMANLVAENVAAV